MVRVVVIGGTGHIGSYLVPRLWERQYEVISVSRGTAEPYSHHRAWSQVQRIHVDRKAEEAEGKFGQRIADLEAEIVVDLMAYEPAQARQIVETLRAKGGCEHYLFCSTIWVYGHLTTVPADEAQACFPLEKYGKDKLEIEGWLMGLARREGFPATSFRPGHIVGRGWQPVNPQGNLDPKVWDTIAAGSELSLPNIGLEMLHHVHADDVALWVMCAIDNRAATIGECFNVVSSGALTMRGFAESMYRYFGQEPKLSYMPLNEWEKTVEASFADTTTTHVRHSPCSSIEKSRLRIGYQPRYTSLEGVQDAVEALIAKGTIKTVQ